MKSESFEKKTLKSALKLGVNENKQTEYTKELMKENHCWRMHGGKRQVQQCNQDKGSGPGLAGYVM